MTCDLSWYGNTDNVLNIIGQITTEPLVSSIDFKFLSKQVYHIVNNEANFYVASVSSQTSWDAASLQFRGAKVYY